MLKELISYKDFDGNERQEYHYFNFTESEIQEMDLRTPGGLKARLDKIVREQDSNQLVTYFKGLILDAYGVKSDDGRRFIKSKELSEAFSQTGAYNKLFMQLTTDTNAAIRFVNGIIPDVKKPEDNIKPVGLPSPESVAARQDIRIPEMPNA
jgi:hypothetical protein